jgi:site-specific DNA-methyltransferase (adenine-specific)
MINWTLGVYQIKSLKAHEKNPRQISKEQFQHLEGLIDKFGLIDKPVLNLDLTIIGGHQRIKVLKRKKVKTVECWVPDRMLEQSEIDNLCIGLNLNQGTFDYDILANEWDVLDLLEWGFTESQLMGVFDDKKDVEKEEKGSKKGKKTTCPMCAHEF